MQAQAVRARWSDDGRRIEQNLLNLAAHELRTPITLLRGYLSMVDDGTIPDLEEFKSVLPSLLAGVEQMSSIVEQLLVTLRDDPLTVPRRRA